MIRFTDFIPTLPLALVTVLLSPVMTPAAMAQVSDRDRGGRTAETLDTQKDGTAPGSFEALQEGLTIGQAVEVKDDRGRATRGRLVSISGDRIVVARRQFPFPAFRPRVERPFAKDTVDRVDIVDSTWNGALIGAAAATAIMAGAIERDCSPACVDNFGRPGRWVLGGLLAVPLGLSAGGLIDSLFNRTAYRRPSPVPRVRIAPSVQRAGGALMVQVEF